MTEQSKGFLFRKRNVLVATLVAGIGLGIYIGKFGIGLGGLGFNLGLAPKNGNDKRVSDDRERGKADDSAAEVGNENSGTAPVETTSNSNQKDSEKPITVSNVVRIVIEDTTYYLKDEKDDTRRAAISLKDLVEFVKQAPGDNDGIRIRVYENANMRMSIESDLKKALEAAGIPETAIFIVPGSPNKSP